MKRIMCYSGGVESAVAAIEVARRYGTEDMILLNHDFDQEVEAADIKQYKHDIADYLGLSVTDCSARETESTLDPIDACVRARAFKVGLGTELCTHRLKTFPFSKWLKENVSPDDCVIYYGFTTAEQNRINRKGGETNVTAGYTVDYPLLWKERTIYDTAEIGIQKPEHYKIWKHGNCFGCLKAGWQHWYCVYVHCPNRWNKAKEAEESIGYSIKRRNKKQCYLKERESEFEALRKAGLPATEHIPQGQFWSMARKLLKNT